MRDTHNLDFRNNQVLHIAHLSPSSGGVASAAKALHLGLLRIGQNSRLFVPHSGGSPRHLPRACSPLPSNKWLRSADVFLRRIGVHFGLGGMINLSSVFWSFPKYDVITLHGMDCNWFNLQALRRLNQTHALVWRMADKHLGTGACGFPEMWGHCQRWQIGCGNCPKAKAEGWLIDSSRLVYRLKKDIIISTQMAVVAPSRWTFEFIRSNPITRHQPLSLIPNGVDTKSFFPLSPFQCRADLGLPLRGKLLLFIAARLDQPRKGSQYYAALLSHLRNCCDEEIAVVLVGPPLHVDLVARLRGILPIFELGRIDDENLLAKVYSASDLLVIPSVVDNCPNVVLESLACGTPVAGFKVGGIPDLVTPDKTGVLADEGDTKTLALEISRLLKDSAKLRRMRNVCREEADQNYSIELQAAKYVSLYRDLLGERQMANK